jgi:3-oxoacyl-[acyl-carrier-protein] synthase II
MKDVYIVDYQVRDCLGTDIGKNYENMLSTPGPETIKRYNVTEFPHVMSTRGFHMNYVDNSYSPFRLAVDLVNEMGAKYSMPKETAVVYGAFAIGYTIKDELQHAFISQQRRFSPTKLFSANHDLLSAMISSKLKLEGINTSLNAACSSSMFNLQFATMLIQTGQAPAALVGAVDMPLFAGMQYYWQCTSAISTTDGGICKPFDKSRDGFLQGEGGTLWYICDEETLVKHNLTPKAKLRSIASGAKVTSMTAHDKTCEHQLKMINQALTQANLTADDISFFNSHATSTLVGDDIELDVFQRAFENIDIPIVSFKGYVGHTMSACGLLESAYGLEAVKNGYLHPNHDLTDPLSDDPRLIVKTTQLKNNIFMKASFGFGGRTSIAIFQSL